MSKTLTSQINIWDLDAVKETLTELGIAFQENQTWSGWYSNQREQVDILVPADRSVNRAFGVGFRQNSEGGLEIVREDLGGQGSQNVVEKFTSIYGMKAAIRQLQKYGYAVTRLDDGTYRARATLKTAGKLARRQAAQPKKAVAVRQLIRSF